MSDIPIKPQITMYCNMSDISLIRISRDHNGSISYYLPSQEAIMMIECKDGLIVMLLEKDKWKK